MYKVVIDANLWISFLIGKRLKKLKDLCSNKNVSVISSPKIIEEYLDVSSRPKVKKYIEEEESILIVLDLIKTFCVDDTDIDVEAPELRDPKDLYLLSLAKANNADFLLTGDKDLLALERRNQTEIISFSNFMARLEMPENKNSPP
jgi:putative PIN family toxin of toxin-antitoxin system